MRRLMVAAETSVSRIITASRRLLSTMSLASTKQRLNCPKQSNSCATRFALDDLAAERRAAFCFLDSREQVRLCSREQLPARQACRFCPSLAQASRKNL